MLLYELRRKFVRVVVDLPRCVSPMQRVVLAAASQVVMFCERSLAGLRDTIRLQTLVREQAPQARLLLVEAGASGERAPIGRGEFEKGVGKSFDARLSYDPKSAGAAANAGQPLPVAAPRSADRARTAPADRHCWSAGAGRCQNAGSLRFHRYGSILQTPRGRRRARRPHRRAFAAGAAALEAPDPAPAPVPPAARTTARGGAGDRSPGGAEHCP